MKNTKASKKENEGTNKMKNANRKKLLKPQQYKTKQNGFEKIMQVLSRVITQYIVILFPTFAFVKAA